MPIEHICFIYCTLNENCFATFLEYAFDEHKGMLYNVT